MKLLIITQKMDRSDPVLGFFHNWVLKLSERFEKISVVCLGKGEIDLPQNVSVYSLGKENTVVSSQHLVARIKYVVNFFKILIFKSLNYDAVFVHMNQEYILLGGIFWKIFGKKVYFWRNHPNGSFLTNIAVWFSEKVFYTSPQSFTARFKKGVLMPVGIDTDTFQISNTKHQIPNSILCLGRISPIKNVDKLIDTAELLDQKGVDFVLDIVGDPVNNEDFKYHKILKHKAEGLIKKGKINFLPAVSQEKVVEIYQTHNIFVNLTASGSMDKTIFEAALCGMTPLAASGALEDFGIAKASTDPKELANAVVFWLNVSVEYKNKIKNLPLKVALNHSLEALIGALSKEIK